MLGLAAGALFVTAWGSLLADQVQARASYNGTSVWLGVAQQRTRTVSGHLQELSRDLRVLKTNSRDLHIRPLTFSDTGVTVAASDPVSG